MQHTIIFTSELIESAFLQVRKSTEEENSPGLYSISDGTLLGKIDALWASIESTISETYYRGKEWMADKINSVIESADRLMMEAGEKMKEVHRHLMQMLQRFMKILVENAIQLIPVIITIGQDQYEISKVSYEQKIVMGGSLKLNLMEAIALTSSGEIQISTEYTKRTEGKTTAP